MIEYKERANNHVKHCLLPEGTSTETCFILPFSPNPLLFECRGKKYLLSLLPSGYGAPVL